MKERITISLDTELAKEVKRAAKNEYKSVSQWMSEKIRHTMDVESVGRKPIDAVKMDVIMSKISHLEELQERIARIDASYERVLGLINDTINSQTSRYIES